MLVLLRVVAIAQILQGFYELAVGAMFLLFPLLPEIRKTFEADSFGEGMRWYVVVIGFVVMFVGALRIIAGFQNWNFKGYILGITTLVLGLVSFLTCYCWPPALLVLILGLVGYLNPLVRKAFDMHAGGMKPADVGRWLESGGSVLPTEMFD